MAANVPYLLTLKLEVSADFEVQTATALGWSAENPVDAAEYIVNAVKGYLVDKYVSQAGIALEKTALDSVNDAKDALRDAIIVKK